MNILVVGGGGREHAIVWKLLQSQQKPQVFCAPGNGGIAQIATCVDIQPTDFLGLATFAKQNKIDLTVVGMDEPLVLGIVDYFNKEGLAIFGPTKRAANIEGSKAFAKNLMKKYNIPTASYETFDHFEEAYSYVKTMPLPIVVKADGLALGKGVVICQTHEEAEQALKEMFVDKKFGQAGCKVVIEEFLIGQELSVLAFCDGKTIVPMPSVVDHKRAKDNDEGLNTGGMGTVSPCAYYTEDLQKQAMEEIFLPTMAALESEGAPFVGVLFFGLMLTKNGPKVIEYNARFGDPETQALMPLLKTDLLPVFFACIEQKLHTMDIDWKKEATACVVLASLGYPEKFCKGYQIKGMEFAHNNNDVWIFHAATKKEGDQFLTNGGRVLGVVSHGKDLLSAIKNTYVAAEQVSFDNCFFRKDIGKKQLVKHTV